MIFGTLLMVVALMVLAPAISVALRFTIAQIAHDAVFRKGKLEIDQA
jgi:hypothetical protein